MVDPEALPEDKPPSLLDSLQRSYRHLRRTALRVTGNPHAAMAALQQLAELASVHVRLGTVYNCNDAWLMKTLLAILDDARPCHIVSQG